MLIGVVGFAGSGKGTVADILIRDYNFTKISFADSVKDAVSVIFSWDRNLLEGDTEESRDFREKEDAWWSKKFGYKVTPRLMLQLMGTEAGRNVFHDQIWVHTVARKIENMKQKDNKSTFVVPDVRFTNEMDFIRQSGGHVIRVVRGSEPEWYDTALKANKEKNTDLMLKYNIHYSEWAWIGENFNYQISNNGTLLMLESDVKHMLKVFTGPAIMCEHSEK